MAEQKYKFYMQKVLKDGTAIGETKDLEVDFVGLRYSRAKGINDIGEQRVYEEKIAESSDIRVFIPETPVYEQTSIELILYFVGENRYDTYNAFNDFVRTGFTKYWDSARNREFIFYVKDEIKIDDELWYGSVPYLKVSYKLQNIKGYTEKHQK